MYPSVVEGQRDGMAGFEQRKMGRAANINFSALDQHDLGFAGANGNVAAAGEYGGAAAIFHIKGGGALDGDIVPGKAPDALGRIGAIRRRAGQRLHLGGQGLRLGRKLRAGGAERGREWQGGEQRHAGDGQQARAPRLPARLCQSVKRGLPGRLCRPANRGRLARRRAQSIGDHRH